MCNCKGGDDGTVLGGLLTPRQPLHCPTSLHASLPSPLCMQTLLGCPFGPPIDLWSIGVVLAEILLRRPLFTKPTPLEVLQQVASLCAPQKVRAEGFCGWKSWHAGEPFSSVVSWMQSVSSGIVSQ
jgi:hypothetical protein